MIGCENLNLTLERGCFLKMNKFKTLLLLIGFLTFFGFSTNGGITKAAEISPMCLTCGGTVTSDYKITAQTRVYGPWKDAFQPLIYGGPSGGSKAYSESESYTSTISSTAGLDVGAIRGLIGYSASYTKSFAAEQRFTLKANTTYKLFERPVYLQSTIRYSVYNLTNGGKKAFKEYKYITSKKAIGNEIILRVQ